MFKCEFASLISSQFIYNTFYECLVATHFEKIRTLKFLLEQSQCTCASDLCKLSLHL